MNNFRKKHYMGKKPKGKKSTKKDNFNGTITILTPTVTGGILSYTYFWSTADTTSALTVLPDETTTYTVTVTDFCGNTATLPVLEKDGDQLCRLF